MTKRFSVLFAFMLIFQTLTSGLGITSHANAEDATSDIVKDVSWMDADGHSIDIDEAEHADEIDMQMDWEVAYEDIDVEETYEMSIDDDLIIDDEQSDDLMTDDEEKVGTYHVSEDGDVIIQFSEALEEHSDAAGSFVIETVYEDEDKEAEEDDSNNNDEGNTEENTDSENENNEASGNADNEDADENNENEAEEADGNEKNESSEDDKEAAENSDDSEENGDENSGTSIMANEEEDGFKLELGEILDLDDEAFDDQNPMDPHEEFNLNLDWELEDGHNYKAGDTVTFDLPKGIYIKKDIEIELEDDSGKVVANAVVTPDKKVELTFTDFVETHSDVSGWMEIISTLDIEEVEEEDGEVIIDPIGEEGELRVPIEKENKDKTIEKNGEPNKGYNADEINWEVTVNKNKTSLENAKITDVLPEGTEYKEDSLKVTKLKVDLDGNVLGDGEEVDITPEENEESELVIPLGDTNDAYRVEYVTEVTDDEEKEFKNNATITDDELDDVSADSTVTINRGDPIKKSAVTDYNPKTGIIEWEIEFNYNQKDLSDVTLEDAWKPEGMLELVEDSMEFQEVSIDENGDAHHEGDAVYVPEGAELKEVTDGFEVMDISTDKAYKVTYQTKVKDRVLDPEDVSNTAGFGSESDGSGTHVGQFYGSKSAGTIDYAEKTIEWTIKVNQDEYPMEDISIEDTLGDGLTLLGDSLNVTVDGEGYDGHTLSGDNPFTIDFPTDYTTDKEIVITYKTEFDADNVPDNKPTNKADITWTPEGENDSITKEVEAGTELNKETKDYSWKNGSYDPETKEITWTIYTNYRENKIDDLNIVDKPQGNQQILDGSAEVKELNIAANGDISEGDTVDDGVANIDEDANTLKVNLGETDKAYKITYKTSLEDLDDMQDEYVNEAEVLDGNENLSDLEAKVGVVKDHKYGDKSGYQDGKQVHWSIDVNLVQQKIKDLKLVDEISDNQEYLEDSITVYHADIDGDGNTSKGDEVSSDEYELEIDQDSGEFTIEWKDEVERAFVVEYSTLFFEKHNEDVRNDYTITGDSIEEDSDAEDGEKVTIEQLGSGGGEGTAGYLIIDKVDTTYDEEESKLEGAEFDLIDKDTGNVLKSGTTDENGQIDFGRLLFGEYELEETNVPDGYVTPEEKQTIEIDKKYESGDDKEKFQYTVENYKPVFAVELSKTDDEGDALEDAEFTLFDSDDKEIAKATTDEGGKILFEDLEEAGTYYVQETKAPAGYVLDDEKHEVEIGEKEQEPVTASAENKSRGAIQLIKTDQDSEEPLEGVEFVLQKENSSGSYETIETFTTDEDGEIKTSNALEAGNYQFVETGSLEDYRTNDNPVKFTVNDNSTEDQEFTMENEQFKGSVKLLKKDAATDEKLEGAQFKLIDSEGETVKEDLETDGKGEIVVDDLFLGEYQLIETKAPEGYEEDDTPIDVEITEDNQVVEKEMTNNKVTEISVEKKWNNDDGDTEPVKVELSPIDETAELNEDNDWQATFKGLDVYDDSGDKINYEVEEVDADGYNSEVSGDASDGFIVTNTETTSVSGTKTWNDDDSNHRPDEITVKLLADGEKEDTTTVSEDDDWTYEFGDLDKYNEDGEEITYTIDEVEVDGYETDIDGFDITNTRTGKTDVNGEKTWKDEDATDRPDEITVNLTREVDGEEDEDFSESKTVNPDSKGKWTYSFEDMDEFDDNGKAYTYTVEEDNVSDKYESKVDGHDITNVRVGETEVSGMKRWKDDTEEDRPDSIEVNLLRDNVVVDTKEVTADDDWKYSFEDLEKYDDEGEFYNYTVKEQDVEGYDSEVSGFDITNTRSEQKDIEVNKTWLDDDSEDRPDSVIVYLKQNGELFDRVQVKAEDDWMYEFTDLEAYDEDGQAYEYTVDEKSIDGYETTIDGFDITNLRVGETEVSGTKTWLDDDSDDRPESITVNLIANEKTDKTVEVDSDSDWEYEFTELDKYDAQGVEIDYSVEEEEFGGYEPITDGYDITNLRVGKTEVAGEKVWEEADDRYRPDSVTVNLFANDEEVDTVEVSDETDWSYAFTDLEKYDDKGKEIDYTIEEADVPFGYKSEVDDTTITNTQKTTEVTGEKTWEEVDERYRPDSVTIQLNANGEKEGTMDVSAETDWDYTFSDLAKYDKDGKKIDYTVEEKEIPAGFDSEVDGTTIENTQETTKVTGEKTWDEVDERYRPDSVTVQLLANGEKEEMTVEVSEESDWQYEFTDLAKYDKEGEEIEYTVEETDVPDGYKSTVDGDNITNKQETTNVKGEKTWDEVDEQYRPDSVTVQLLANGEEEATVDVAEETDWRYEFTDLAKYDKNGEKISYTVEEVDGPVGYETEVDGYTITNTQKTTEVSGSKTWLDNDSDKRPDTITVQLKNGEDVLEEKEVTDGDDWQYEFTDLAKYDKGGDEIDYTVDEKEVDGYEKSIDGHDITNTRAGTTEVDIAKQWEDDDKSERPDTITVNLQQEGDVYEEYEVTAEDDWTTTITDLPKYDDEGKRIEYSVKEQDLDDYESSYSGDQSSGFTITNTFVEEDEESDDGDDPDKTEKDSDDDQDSPDAEVSKDAESKDKEDALPKTSTNMFNWMVAGAIFLLTGTALIFILRKRREE